MKLVSIGVFVVAAVLAGDLAYRIQQDRARATQQTASAELTRKAAVEAELQNMRLSAWREGISRMKARVPAACSDYASVKTFEWADAQITRLGTVEVHSFLSCYDTKGHRFLSYPWKGTAVRADEPGHWYMDDITITPAPQELPAGSHVTSLKNY